MPTKSVLAVSRHRVSVESGARLDKTQWAPTRVAVLSHWASTPRVSLSADSLIRELLKAGFDVLVVSTADGEGSLVWPEAAPDSVLVLRRPNVGYDFGSWAVALDRYPGLARARQVLLANDSMLGPFRTLAPVLERMAELPVDVWGMTSSAQFGHHLQSYFLCFRDGILGDPPLRRFWRSVRVERTKQEIIMRNEVGLGRLLSREAYSTAAAFPYYLAVASGQNPTILGWHRLIDAGFPFVKRELVVNPTVAPDARHVPAVVRATFGVEVQDWI